MKFFRPLVLAVVGLLLAAAPAAAAGKTVTLMTHDSFAVSKGLIKAFETANDCQLKIIKSGDAGAALSQAILSKHNPLADVFFGVDNTFLSRALKAGIFEPYAAPGAVKIPAELKLDKTGRLIPVDFGEVCLNYDIAWFKKKGLAPPQSLADLTKPAYKGLTVVTNPATSSPGLAFLLTTVGAFGEDGWLGFWKNMRANEVYVTNGWSDAYFGQFTRAKGGSRPIVLSYASSPAAEVFFAKTKPAASPTGAMLSPGSAFRQVEFVGLLKGAKNPELGKKLIDFMLSQAFQKDIPLNMWVFPAVEGVPLPEVFTKYSRAATKPVMLSPAEIEAKREQWIEAWTETVLR